MTVDEALNWVRKGEMVCGGKTEKAVKVLANEVDALRSIVSNRRPYDSVLLREIAELHAAGGDPDMKQSHETMVKNLKAFVGGDKKAVTDPRP